MKPDLEAIRERCESLLDSYDCYPHSMPHVAIELVDDDIPALLAYVEKLERVLCEIYETAEVHVASRSGSRLVRIASMALAAVEGE